MNEPKEEYFCKKGLEVLIFLCVAIGIGLRVGQFVQNRSLWLDEASLALNIISRDYWELLGPLDYSQAAPIIFLLISKLSCYLFGEYELSLRLYPLVCGVLSVGVFCYLVSCIYQASLERFIANSLFCFNYFLVYYAQEFKQYSSDVLVCLVLVVFFYHHLKSNSFFYNKYRIVFWGTVLFGCLSQLMSHPSIFILGGFCTVLLGRRLFVEEGGSIFDVVSVSAVWLLIFLLNYVLFLRNISSNDSLEVYWTDGFVSSSLSWNTLISLCNVYTNVLAYSFNIKDEWFICVLVYYLLIFVGIVWLFLHEWKFIFLILSVIILVTLASMLHKYPLEGRLTLFLIPLLIILITSGVSYFLRLRSVLLSVCLLFVILVPCIRTFYQLSFFPFMVEEVRPALNWLDKNNTESNDILVNQAASHSLKYYFETGRAVTVGDVDTHRFHGLQSGESIFKSLVQDRPKWLLISHLERAEHNDLINRLNNADKQVTIIQIKEYHGCWLYLLKWY